MTIESRWSHFWGGANQLLIYVRVAEDDTAGWKAAGGETLPAFEILEVIMLML